MPVAVGSGERILEGIETSSLKHDDDAESDGKG
jgi:hypothetical protein